MPSGHDLDDLRLLLTVAESGSIGQAAIRRHSTQPTVSRRMAALERSLGVPLLNRTKQGTSLTSNGQVVVDWAADLLAAADGFRHSVETLREHSSAMVKVAVSMTIAEHHAPGWVSLLADRSPGTTVALLVRNSTDVADLVESGGADLGFVESPTVRRTLGRRRIGWDRLVVAVAPDHPWATSKRLLTPPELAAGALLVREEGSGTRETLGSALRRHGLQICPAMEMASNTALKAAALAGIGAVVVSEMALAPEIANGQLVAVAVSDLPLRRPLTCVWRPRQPLTPGAAALLAVAGQHRPGLGAGAT